MKVRKRITEHQILFAVSFLVGIILMTVLANGKRPENTIMDQALSKALLEDGWNKKELFLQCLWRRGCVFGVIIAAAGTSIRKGIFRLITVWIGAAFGIMVKLFYLWYGIKGFGLFFVSLIPQYIFYWMAYGLLYWESEEKYMRSRTNYFPIILTIGVVIMGILLESYVNPILVSGYAKILF